MINVLLEQFADDPKGTAIGCISALAVLGGLTIGFQRGAFNPDPMQQRLETKQQNHALQKQSDRKSTRLNSSHITPSRMPSSA